MIRLFKLVLFLFISLFIFALPASVRAQEQAVYRPNLSPVWPYEVSRWDSEIGAVAERYHLDPDLLASIVLMESAGIAESVSYVGAIGLMGVMPSGPNFEFRPSAEALSDPELNLSWGAAILADILAQSGGDLAAGLSAYNAGWVLVDLRVPQEYAANVLHYYGRAVAVRNSVRPEVALRWSVAVEIRQGNIAPTPFVMAQEPDAELYLFGEHVAYRYVDAAGRMREVKGYAVPLALNEEEWDSAEQIPITAYEHAK